MIPKELKKYNEHNLFGEFVQSFKLYGAFNHQIHYPHSQILNLTMYESCLN